ncbi:MAG TPA: type II secretion system F family protein [Stellaceae bacterium]|nr:type II secretion system F family protein [Stellaceae bacterium]
MSAMPVSNFRIEQWLPAGLGLEDVIAVTAGLAMVATFFAMWHAFRGNSSLERRLTQIADKKEAMRQAAIASRRQRERMTPASVMRDLVMRFDLLRSRHATDARMTLARAGLRSRDAMIRYLFARLALPIAFAVAMLINNYTVKLIPVPPNFSLAAAALAGVFGYFAPGIYIKNLTTKRAKRIQLALPDGLDLMVICAEAGLSLDATLIRVSKELESTWPELAEELGITAAELTFLPDRRQAFENLTGRTDMGSIKGVVNTLTQTAKFGTPLAQSLRVLAAEFRDARMFKAEEKAARLPALMTVPMILFILPTLFIVLLGPAGINIVDTFSRR